MAGATTEMKPNVRGKKGAKGSGKGKPSKTPAALKADRHILYQKSVQCVEAEIDFVDDTYKDLRGYRASIIREDFGGTGYSACEWASRRPDNIAYTVDLDEPTQTWGKERNVPKLKGDAAKRVHFIEENVLDIVTPEKPDIVLAMNFSYYIFKERDTMRRYFKHVRETLADGGLFILDAYGGYESFKECEEIREIDDNFDYVWDQHSYNPITGEMQCYIHFHFSDGSKMKRAFSYNWRMWTMPEIREILAEAGFSRSTCYWEGADDDGEGDGNFEPAETADADPSWIAYVVAEP
jgi:hypothetical protein